MTKYCLIYSTCNNEDEAKKIIYSLLDLKLIACANLFPKGQSFFLEDNKTCVSEEWYFILKTTATNYSAIESCIKNLHSYVCPAIFQISIKNGHNDFLKWITDQTAI